MQFLIVFQFTNSRNELKITQGLEQMFWSKWVKKYWLHYL